MTWGGTSRGRPRGGPQPGRSQQWGGQHWSQHWGGQHWSQHWGGQGQLVLTGLLLQLLPALRYMVDCGGGPEDLGGRHGSTTYLPDGCQDVHLLGSCQQDIGSYPKLSSPFLSEQSGRPLAPPFPPYFRSLRCRRYGGSCRGSCRDSLLSCRTPGASRVAPAGGRRERILSMGPPPRAHVIPVTCFTRLGQGPGTKVGSHSHFHHPVFTSKFKFTRFSNLPTVQHLSH